MKILITGAKGFTAAYLLKNLQNDIGNEIFCTDLQGDRQDRYHACDLTDDDAIYQMISRIRPDQIYHLAGTYSNHYETDYRANVLSTKNICDSLVALSLPCRLLLIGSAGEYGRVTAEDNPIKESHPLNPVSIYGMTKTFQTLMMKYYVSAHALDIVMARTFNLMGKGLSTRLFIGRLYQQIDDFRKGVIDRIQLGNLSHKRDYLDVQQAVKCYQSIMNAGKVGEIYNVGSGISVRILDLLEKILKENHLSMDIVTENNPLIPGKLDIEDIFADTGKLQKIQSVEA